MSDAQAGAFLMAMRWKGEAPEELAGMAQALRDAAEPLRTRSERPLVCCGSAYDGSRSRNTRVTDSIRRAHGPDIAPA